MLKLNLKQNYAVHFKFLIDTTLFLVIHEIIITLLAAISTNNCTIIVSPVVIGRI